MNTSWKHGEKTKLAREAGTTPQRLHEYALGEENGGRTPNRQLALKLEKASRVVLGKGRAISATAWMQLEKHPMIDNFFSKRK